MRAFNPLTGEIYERNSGTAKVFDPVTGEFISTGLPTVVTPSYFDDLVAAISGTVVVGVGVSVNGTEQTIEYTNLSDLSDYAWTSYQLKHAWKPGSTLQPHIHWQQNANNTPNWLIQYRWQTNGVAKTTAWTNYKCNTNVFTYSSGILNQISKGAGLTPPVGYSLSDILQIRILRDNANTSTLFSGADPYSGTASVTSNDLHLEFGQLGSTTEYQY